MANPRGYDPRSGDALTYRRWYGTARWKRRRLDQLRAHPFCVMCMADGEVRTPATVADHVTPHKGDARVFWTGPLQSLCAPHHDRDKQMQEMMATPLAVGEDGWPTDPNHMANGGTGGAPASRRRAASPVEPGPTSDHLGVSASQRGGGRDHKPRVQNTGGQSTHTNAPGFSRPFAEAPMTQHAQVVEAARSPWPADTIQMRPLEALVPYASNPRTHSPGQVEQIAASIREWGWTVPILVDDEGGIIAGHGRVLAATLLGVTEVPVVVARGWTEDQKRAYVIADNQLTLNGAWDLDLLQAELGKLQEVGFDMGLLGFDPDDLGAHLGGWDTDLDGHTTDPDDLGGLGAKFTVTFDADNKDAMADVREVVVTYLRENNIVAAVA